MQKIFYKLEQNEFQVRINRKYQCFKTSWKQTIKSRWHFTGAFINV